MTIITLYNYDDTIFDNFNVPEADTDNGIPAAVKSVAIAKILLDCAELEVMYPDPDFMKYAITNWSAINATKWKKLWYTENVLYDPIANVDATETETRDLTYTRDDQGNFQGFNSSTYQNVTQDDNYDTEAGTVTKDRHGNIGVTSTQQLLESERNVSDFSMYQIIADDFKKSFCVLVY